MSTMLTGLRDLMFQNPSNALYAGAAGITVPLLALMTFQMYNKKERQEPIHDEAVQAAIVHDTGRRETVAMVELMTSIAALWTTATRSYAELEECVARVKLILVNMGISEEEINNGLQSFIDSIQRSQTVQERPTVRSILTLVQNMRVHIRMDAGDAGVNVDANGFPDYDPLPFEQQPDHNQQATTRELVHDLMVNGLKFYRWWNGEGAGMAEMDQLVDLDNGDAPERMKMILRELKDGDYQCTICLDTIQHTEESMWACRSCTTVYHRGCLKEWSVATLHRGGTWHCPSCRAISRLPVDLRSQCWCGSRRNGQIRNDANPGSCSQQCTGELRGQQCSLPCHPGPHHLVAAQDG